MRVIAGRWRGRRLEAPPGRSTRPTSDRVREAVFSAVDSRLGGWDDVRVADLYAGSGALGIEALSRGASHVVFVESDLRAAQCIHRNLMALGVTENRATVLSRRVEATPPATLAPSPVSLLFADPPYRIDAAEVTRIVRLLGEAGTMRAGTLVVYEHAAGTMPVWPAGFSAEEPRVYGDTAVSFARYEGEGERCA